MNQYQIKHLGSDDFLLAQHLADVFQKVFESESTSHPPKSHLQNILNKPDFIALVALYENEVIGGLTAYELPMLYGEIPEVYIYDIGVGVEHQRMGLGKRLLSALNAYCKRRGIKEIFVDVNEEDQHALDFYNATGGFSDNVVQFTYFV